MKKIKFFIIITILITFCSCQSTSTPNTVYYIDAQELDDSKNDILQNLNIKKFNYIEKDYEQIEMPESLSISFNNKNYSIYTSNKKDNFDSRYNLYKYYSDDCIFYLSPSLKTLKYTTKVYSDSGNNGTPIAENEVKTIFCNLISEAIGNEAANYTCYSIEKAEYSEGKNSYYYICRASQSPIEDFIPFGIVYANITQYGEVIYFAVSPENVRVKTTPIDFKSETISNLIEEAIGNNDYTITDKSLILINSSLYAKCDVCFYDSSILSLLIPIE